MTVSTTTATELAPGSTAFVAMTGVSTMNKFDLRFDEFRNTVTATPTPAPTPGGPEVITYAVLTGTGTNAVFAQSCIGCHRTGSAAGNLNLQDYTSAKNAAATILSRMKNAASPMPTTGLLPAAKADIIQQWINNGTPQN